jgi:hypothetical protein
MANWDRTLGDPADLDRRNAELKILDPVVLNFAQQHEASVIENYHNAPSRQIHKVCSDGIARTIDIRPVQSLQPLPRTRNRDYSIAAMFWLDERQKKTRTSGHWSERFATFEELQQNLAGRLENFWSRMLAIDVAELKKHGRVSRLGPPTSAENPLLP